MKTFKIISIVIVILTLLFTGYSLGQKKSNDTLETYNRQLQGQLTDKEKELQSLHRDIGVARSDLMTQEELAEKLKKENEEYDAKFAAFLKNHNLEIASRDKTIAELKQKIVGGDTEVVIIPSEDGTTCVDLSKNCVIQYSWQDFFRRFKLTDPNIFEENNEVFESKQIFKIYGEIYQQKEGSLQTRRLVLREVYAKADGTYGDMPDAKAEIVDSEFLYINPPRLPDEELDIFHPRVIMFGDINLLPNPGKTKFGLGAELLSLKGLGLSTNLAIDFQDPKLSEFNLGLEYTPKFSGVDLNLGIGVFGGTPFNNFLKEFSLSAGVVFYITN